MGDSSVRKKLRKATDLPQQTVSQLAPSELMAIRAYGLLSNTDQSNLIDEVTLRLNPDDEAAATEYAESLRRLLDLTQSIERN